VGNIKSKFCALVLYTITLSTLLIFALAEICNADDDTYKISIIDEPTYKITNTIEKNGRIIGMSYQINIIFTNTGYQKSGEIEVNLTDQEGFVLIQRTYLNAGETKTIIFNWSTINIKNQKLIVNYYPSNLDIPLDNFNSGQKIFTIKIADGSMPSTSTPGFEIILLITATLFVSYLLKRNG
jgi:hypothetical protein